MEKTGEPSEGNHLIPSHWQLFQIPWSVFEPGQPSGHALKNSQYYFAIVVCVFLAIIVHNTIFSRRNYDEYSFETFLTHILVMVHVRDIIFDYATFSLYDGSVFLPSCIIL